MYRLVGEDGDTCIQLSNISLDSLIIQEDQGKSSRTYVERDIDNPLSPLISQDPFHYGEPEVCSSNNTPDRSHSNIKARRIHPTGWRFGSIIAAVVTFTILVVNITLLAVLTSDVRRKGYEGGVAPIRTDDCGAIKKLGVGIHLLINVLSTILFGASNYYMQTICSPTRRDVERAHSQGSWVDTGIPSIRNLRFIQKRRLLVWACLGLSSIPLHFVYNSVLFVSTTNYLYQGLIADEAFLNGASYSETFRSHQGISGIQQKLIEGGHYQNISNEDCIRGYSQHILDDKGDVILIVDPPDNCTKTDTQLGRFAQYWDPTCNNTKNSSIYGSWIYQTNATAKDSGQSTNWHYWVCSQSPTSGNCSSGGWRTQLTDLPSWKVADMEVKYCLSQNLSNQCQLKVAINLLAVVICCNFIKFVIMVLLAASNLVNKEPLVTLGDATASFIETPDQRTQGVCLLAAEDITMPKDQRHVLDGVYKPRKRALYATTSGDFWAIPFTLNAVGLTAIAYFLTLTIGDLEQNYSRGNAQSLWELGIGAINPYTLIFWDLPMTGDASIVAATLVANLPQVLLSFLYLVYNAIITSMASGVEWSSYAHKSHRPLRVSFPKGNQRSTFFLQLPYRYIIPKMILSILVHWLVSQSVFVVQIFERRTWVPDEFTDSDEYVPGRDAKAVTTAAYSPMGIILTGVGLVAAYVIVIIFSRLRLPAGMPIVGTCSLAIAASCHTLRGTSSLRPLKWGVVTSAVTGQNHVDHCSFSNDEVGFPEAGERYE